MAQPRVCPVRRREMSRQVRLRRRGTPLVGKPGGDSQRYNAASGDPLAARLR